MRYSTIPDIKEKRAMNLHEYQSKRLFADYGIPVPRGIPVKSPNAAVDAAKELGGDLWVVKAQVHAGGRGNWLSVWGWTRNKCANLVTWSKSCIACSMSVTRVLLRSTR